MSHCFIKLKLHKTAPLKNQMWYYKVVADVTVQNQLWKSNSV